MRQFISVSLIGLPLIWSACARFQPTQAATSPSDYSLAGITQSVTMKDSSVHYDPAVLVTGESRQQVAAAFGEPNASQTNDAGLIEDVYAFNPDGTKFVNPQVRPRNFALAFFTMGTSIAVRQARLHLTEEKLTLYHVTYTNNDKIASVREERMEKAPDHVPAAAPSPDNGIE